jgi:hypothetical protein
MGIRLITRTAAGLTTATTAYTSGDVVGTEMLFDIGEAGAARGEIGGVTIIDKAGVLGACDLFLFDAPSTPAADNAPNSWADADMANLICVVPAATVYTSALNRAIIWIPPNDDMPYVASTNVLYGVLVTRTANGFFGAVGDVIVKLFIEQGGGN